nr:hypothetical protein [Rhodoferax sp.]
MREKLGEKLFSKMVSKRSFLKKAGAAAGVVGAYSVGATSPRIYGHLLTYPNLYMSVADVRNK